MDTKDLLVEELQHVPEPLLAEIMDFVRFLKAKAAQETFGGALLAESALRKDWLRPEEEEAWRDL